ncbi:MAG: PdxA family dehydrogenase [Planctomycetota bacterium]|jgi:4-hydroxythreonine-4-phosphate dehydrogenase
MKKPIIAITMGDASGIGPELIVKVFSEAGIYEFSRPFVIGSPEVMTEAARVAGKDLHINVVQNLSEAGFAFSRLDVLCPESVQLSEIQWGKLDPMLGKAAAMCLRIAFEMAVENKIDGVVSAPLNKEAFHLAGYDYLDELEYLGELTNSSATCVIGAMQAFWTVAVTLHIPFRQIADGIKKDRVLRYIRLMDDTLKNVGIPEPRIAVAALNVHGGEGGLFGREEMDEIKPAIKEAQKFNPNVGGPFAADSVFVMAMDEGYDAVVCMYHDQANIARKLLAKKKGASLFMGLPVPCGTTAHGTAFDIAGKGVSDPGSLQDALKYVAMLAAQGKQEDY